MPDYVVKCAKCDVALKEPTDSDPQGRAECPRCGIGDSLENVLAEAGEYLTEQLADTTERNFAAGFRNSKNMKLSISPRPHKTYRFIVDLEP